MSQTNFSRYKYMPDNMNESDFLARFVVRQEVFEDIFRDVKNTNFDVPAQHQIIVGQRGQGKTTLLRRVEIAARDDKELSRFLLVVKFPEEQNNIRFLYRFWEEIALYLEEYIGAAHQEMEKHAEDDDYDMENFSYLEKELKKSNKKLLVLMDNIDLFLDTLKEREQQRLREILLTSSSILIIGGSAQMLEQHFDYGKPFYQFFKITTLEGLGREETITLLRAVARDDEKEKIEAVIKNNSEKIEALRQLTGGIPRLAILLFDILIDDHDSAFGQMEKLLDEITPFYQDRLRQLPPTLKDIAHAIAMNWDGIETSEIAKKTRLTSKEASAQLQQLKKYHFIESVSVGKNNIYKIKERFFNIWYLMRYGRKKDIQRVEWLVKFLTTWYSKDELEEKSKRFIDSIKTDNAQDSYVYHMGEALRYSVADINTERELKEELREYLSSKQSNLINDLSPSSLEILEKAFSLHDDGKISEAIMLLEKSKKRVPEESSVLNNFRIIQKSEKKIEELSLEIAMLLERYLEANEHDSYNALFNLSLMYFKLSKDAKKALEDAIKSVEKGKDFYGMFTLSIILLWNEEFSLSYEKFEGCLRVDDTSNNESLIQLYINLLISKGQLYKAKEFFEMERYQLKDRLKPIWYALMTLMQKEFPHEIKKMGSELQESVNSVLEVIENLKIKYQI